MDQRRILLTVTLCFAVLYGYQFFLSKYYPQKPQGNPLNLGTPEAPPEPAAQVPSQAQPSSGLAAALDEGALVDVETDLFRLQLTPIGARIARLELKRFQQTVAADSPPLELVSPAPLLPITLQFESGQSDAGLKFSADRAQLSLTGQERGTLVFSATAPDGARVQKRYEFTGDSYLFQVSLAGANSRSVGLVLTPLAKGSAGGGRSPGQESVVALAGTKLTQQDTTSVAKNALRLEDASWVGFAAQYFLFAALPSEGAGTAVAADAGDGPVVRLDAPLRDGAASFSIYAGPKDTRELEKIGQDLKRVVDYGWFWFIAIPLLEVLRWLHRMVGNYGVAIIILTAGLKILTLPLTRWALTNMRQMQKIQPQMTRLRERYKDDQEALMREMQQLYKQHGVNPATGCLPMLGQIPFFVGLYNALLHAIELRHAPFALWINDLSAPDRLMLGGIGIPVMTILMGASMLVQQWLSPQQGDPTQQRMMMIMPIIFTYMFLSFPSGLVLYWLVNNVLSIGQQYYMLRTTEQPAR